MHIDSVHFQPFDFVQVIPLGLRWWLSSAHRYMLLTPYHRSQRLQIASDNSSSFNWKTLCMLSHLPTTVKLAFNDADTDADTDSPNMATSLRPTHAISSRSVGVGVRIGVVECQHNSIMHQLTANYLTHCTVGRSPTHSNWTIKLLEQWRQQPALPQSTIIQLYLPGGADTYHN